MNFAELSDLPPWLKSGMTFLIGAGAAKLLAVWLENKRLANNEYRDTLLQRIRELEAKIDVMHETNTRMAVRVATLQDDLDECKRLHNNADHSGPA